MQPYQQRVVDEYKALEEKAVNLFRFIKSTSFADLPEKDQDLLKEQYIAMQSYMTILSHRIDRFEN